MLVIEDGMNRTLTFERTPDRVISLVPSLTETLFDLGVGSSIVGRTKFCIHPKLQIKAVPIVGGTKKVRIEKIKALKPGLIIANKEENTKQEIEQLSKQFNTYISDIKDFEDLNKFITDMASIFNVHNRAKKMLDKMGEFTQLKSTLKYKVVYIIWQEPLITVGNDTFIQYMLSKAGFMNAFEHKLRYPVITEEDIKRADPDCIFLSSEPYPFTEKHVREFKNKFQNIEVRKVDGEMFSWYGSRVLRSKQYFEELQSCCN